MSRYIVRSVRDWSGILFFAETETKAEAERKKDIAESPTA
jgi:hypothetical protein